MSPSVPLTRVVLSNRAWLKLNKVINYERISEGLRVVLEIILGLTGSWHQLVRFQTKWQIATESWWVTNNPSHSFELIKCFYFKNIILLFCGNKTLVIKCNSLHIFMKIKTLCNQFLPKKTIIKWKEYFRN